MFGSDLEKGMEFIYNLIVETIGAIDKLLYWSKSILLSLF